MQMMMATMDAWLGLVIDIGLLLGFFFLWLSWYRNGKRQQKLEQLLADTAQQLEQATHHLSEASAAIEQLKHPASSQAAPARVRKAVEPEAVRPTKTSVDNSAPLPAQNSTQATMIMRMKREGDAPETIAERLDLPLAQVKLMLKLHAASRSN